MSLTGSGLCKKKNRTNCLNIQFNDKALRTKLDFGAMKITEGLDSFFCCFHAEVVVLSIISLAGKSKLSEEAKVGSCWFK